MMPDEDDKEIQINYPCWKMNSILNEPLLRSDEHLDAFQWPASETIDFPPLTGNDCLLLCSGFEDRAIETLRRTCAAGRTGFSLGLISYLPKQAQNRTEELYAIGKRANLQVTDFLYNRENPTGIGEKLGYFTRTFDRVFVDISGMSRLLIVQTLVALINEQCQDINIIYGEAEEYPPTKDKFEQDNKDNNTNPILSYLSSGIFEIAAAPELSSVSMLGEAIRLIAFPTFDPAQLTNLLQELQPAYTEFIHGVPPAQENKWRTEAIRKLNHSVLSELRGKRDHELSTLDYRETLHKLLQIYAERSMFDRIVIAPTGSKMQAVAVGIFRAALHDVQIVYPTPQVFTEPEEYTLGLRQLYQIDIPVEAFAKIIKNHRDDFSD